MHHFNLYVHSVRSAAGSMTTLDRQHSLSLINQYSNIGWDVFLIICCKQPHNQATVLRNRLSCLFCQSKVVGQHILQSEMSSFSDHPGWEDVIPVAQDDGPNAVVTIAYTPLCKYRSCDWLVDRNCTSQESFSLF